MLELFHIKNRPKVEKICRIIFNALVILCVLFFLFTLIGNYRPEFIASDSMYPLLKKGDIVWAKKIQDNDEIVVDNIYTYKIPGEMFTVTHRCVDVKTVDGEICYIFKGDNNRKPDPVPVKKSWVKYRLIKK